MGDGSKIIKLGAVHMESSSSSAGKRTRGPSNSLHVPSCLVDGCRSDLSKCRDYHRRHKVCEAHSKTPKVTISGQEQRFCQQCSRFHSLGEFDEEKRSCRKRLDGHNRRRRKPQPETLSLNAPRFLAAYQGTRYTPTTFPSSGLALGANPSTNMAAIYNPQSQSIAARKHSFTGSLMAHNYTMQSHQSHMGSNHPELSQCGSQKVFSEWLHHHHRDDNNNNNNNDDNNSVVESSCALSLLSSTQTGSSSSSASSSTKGTTGVSHHHHHHQMMMQPDRSHSLAPTGLHYHSGNLGLFGQPIVSSGLVISEVNEDLANFHCHDMFRN